MNEIRPKQNVKITGFDEVLNNTPKDYLQTIAISGSSDQDINGEYKVISIEGIDHEVKRKTTAVGWSEALINHPGWCNVQTLGELSELERKRIIEEQQQASRKDMEASLRFRADYFGFFKAERAVRGSKEATRFSEKLQKFAQTVSDEKPSTLRADELLQSFVREARHSRPDSEAFKLKSRGNKYDFKKRGRY